MARPANTYRAARRNLVIRTNGLLWPSAYKDANERAGRQRTIYVGPSRHQYRERLGFSALVGSAADSLAMTTAMISRRLRAR